MRSSRLEAATGNREAAETLSAGRWRVAYVTVHRAQCTLHTARAGLLVLQANTHHPERPAALHPGTPSQGGWCPATTQTQGATSMWSGELTDGQAAAAACRSHGCHLSALHVLQTLRRVSTRCQFLLLRHASRQGNQSIRPPTTTPCTLQRQSPKQEGEQLTLMASPATACTPRPFSIARLQVSRSKARAAASIVGNP